MNVSELQKLRIKELTELAIKLEIDSYSGMNRQELIVKILEAQMEKDGGVTARGVLEVLNEVYSITYCCFVKKNARNAWPYPLLT